jgi:hypothetical protein
MKKLLGKQLEVVATRSLAVVKSYNMTILVLKRNIRLA